MASTMAGLVWIIGLLKSLNVKFTLTVNVYSDSKTTLQIATNLVYHERTKHIEIDYRFIKEKITKGLISMKYITTSKQPADILTKGLRRV